MIYINFSDLSEEKQNELIDNSIEDVKAERNKELKKRAREMNISYDTLLQETAMSNLYSYTYVFNI